jgi:hypothetical protein
VLRVGRGRHQPQARALANLYLCVALLDAGRMTGGQRCPGAVAENQLAGWIDFGGYSTLAEGFDLTRPWSEAETSWPPRRRHAPGCARCTSGRHAGRPPGQSDRAGPS